MEIYMPIIIAVVIIAAIYIFYRSTVIVSTTSNTTKVTIGKTTIEAEIADTLPKQITGLMFRKSLPEDRGMLFIFDRDDYHGIWMMNMSISLDIVWINSDYKIVDIVKNAPPCKLVCPVYRPKDLARYVLEVNSGFTDNYSIKIGDMVKF